MFIQNWAILIHCLLKTFCTVGLQFWETIKSGTRNTLQLVLIATISQLIHWKLWCVILQVNISSINSECGLRILKIKNVMFHKFCILRAEVKTVFVDMQDHIHYVFIYLRPKVAHCLKFSVLQIYAINNKFWIKKLQL